MKRINFSVDFEDKELFEKSVKDAIEAQIKTIARDLIPEMIEKEITRLVNKELQSYEFKQMVKKEAKDLAAEVTHSFDFSEFMKEKWNESYECTKNSVIRIISEKAESMIKENLSQAVLSALFANKKADNT